MFRAAHGLAQSARIGVAKIMPTKFAIPAGARRARTRGIHVQSFARHVAHDWAGLISTERKIARARMASAFSGTTKLADSSF